MSNPKKEFSKIYDQYIDKIYRFIFFKVNSQEITQDLTSETFLRCWECYKSGTNIENPQAFLFQVARNLVIDHYREKNKSQAVSTEFVSIIDPKSDLKEKSLLNSDLEQVRHALSDLKEDYQNVIVWHYLDELSIPEVAYILGRSEEATRVLLHRALNSLRKRLNSA